MMRKLWTVTLTAAVMGWLLAGCSGSSGASAAEELTAAQAGESIGQAVSLDGLKERDRNQLLALYSIEAEQVEDFVLYTSSSNVRADELAIIQVKDANDVQEVLAGIRKRVEAQAAKFQDYLPAEYYLLEHHVLKAKGRLILFAVSDEAGRIEEAFDRAMK